VRRLAILLAVSFAVVAVAPAAHSADEQSLAGRVIVLDPGHQLGNSNPRFARQMAQTRFNGSIVKGCNTSGTATNAGFPEATFTWRVAKELRRILQARGATVVLTRDRNSRKAWGPCVWDRARIGTEAKADAMVSIHADGAPARANGFFAIAPAAIPGWTDDVVRVDRRLAKAMIAGMTDAGAPPANYVRDQLQVRRDQSTLNFSDVPTVIIEVGNMRNAGDARRMSSAEGQRKYAEWLAAGIERFFTP
jgi:N-acetylmuramoyl-L-alanine amidase